MKSVKIMPIRKPQFWHTSSPDNLRMVITLDRRKSTLPSESVLSVSGCHAHILQYVIAILHHCMESHISGSQGLTIGGDTSVSFHLKTWRQLWFQSKPSAKLCSSAQNQCKYQHVRFTRYMRVHRMLTLPLQTPRQLVSSLRKVSIGLSVWSNHPFSNRCSNFDATFMGCLGTGSDSHSNLRSTTSGTLCGFNAHPLWMN